MDFWLAKAPFFSFGSWLSGCFTVDGLGILGRFQEGVLTGVYRLSLSTVVAG